MSGLSRDSMIRQLTALGFSESIAAARVDAELAAMSAVRVPVFPGAIVGVDLAVPGADRTVVQELRPAIEWPVRLLLPWSYLVSDNERKEPYAVKVGEKYVGRMRLTAAYAKAKEQIEQLAKGKLGDALPAEIPLELTARVYVPLGIHWKNDVCNFAKGVHDALEGVVYRNDNLLHATHWIRAGVDVDAPRAELTIVPLVSGG